MTHSDELRWQRSEARCTQGALFDRPAGVLSRHDPVGINVGFSVDECRAEAESIPDRPQSCGSAAARFGGARGIHAVVRYASRRSA